MGHFGELKLKKKTQAGFTKLLAKIYNTFSHKSCSFNMKWSSQLNIRQIHLVQLRTKPGFKKLLIFNTTHLWFCLLERLWWKSLDGAGQKRVSSSCPSPGGGKIELSTTGGVTHSSQPGVNVVVCWKGHVVPCRHGVVQRCPDHVVHVVVVVGRSWHGANAVTVASPRHGP